MPRTKLSEYSTTNSSNTDIEGINIDEGCAPSGINNAIRELMVHLKEFQTGASGDAFTFAGGVLISGTANTITGNVLMSGTNTITGSTTATFAAGAVGTPSIAAHGDTNTGIFFPAADTIAFAEGGAEAMRIDSSGNLGIGKTSPSANRIIDAYRSNDSLVAFQLTNDNAGTSAQTHLRLLNGTATTVISQTGTGYTTSGQFRQSSTVIYGDGAGGMALNVASAQPMTFATSDTERMRIDSSGNVGIGTSSPTDDAGYGRALDIRSATGAAIYFRDSDDITNDTFVIGRDNANSYIDSKSGNILIYNAGSERARITSGGDFLVGNTAVNSANNGFIALSSGRTYITVTDLPVLTLNRKTTDGTLLSFQQDTTEEGTISVSGNTVSYNGFSGGHWTQLPEGRGYNPEILRGTVMSSIGEMCEWKSVEWNEVIEHPAVPAVEAKEAVVDEEGNVVEPAVEAVEGKDAWTETIPHREAYLGQLPIGATFEEDGVTKTVVDDGNERLPKVKISDVVGDKAVYGVFQTWDEVQDMLVTSLGAFVVRIAAGVTVQIGDLLESNGDGCAKVQDDDVIRSKTIGKVTSITPSATYADGSYTVPAVLYCG